MGLWEMRCGNLNNFSGLVYVNDEDVWANLFGSDGTPKHWQTRPKVQPFVNKRKKKQLPQADFAYLTPGTIFLSEKAFGALQDFFEQFGQLLPVDCVGEPRYYLNITNLISVVDYDNSVKTGTAVTSAAFLADATPISAQIFKDPLTAKTRIYLTDAAKAIIEQRIAEFQLTGLLIAEAGGNTY